MILKSSKGVTMMEILIVIMIMTILAVMWGVNRKSQMNSVFRQEARMLLDDIMKKEKLYYASTNPSSFFASGGTVDTLNMGAGGNFVNAKKNFYYKTFSVSIVGDNTGFKAIAYGASGTSAEGINVTLKYDQASGNIDRNPK